MKRLTWIAFALAACGTDPAQVAGNYTTALTNRDNGCNYANWTVGAQTTGVGVMFTQSDKSISATVTGIAGALLTAGFGTNVFTGTISGVELDLTITGNVGQTMGNCAYTRDAEIVANYANNTITGSVHYTNKDNANSDCIPGCVSVQDFAGSRPPQ